jgi:hypothetical protein
MKYADVIKYIETKHGENAKYIMRDGFIAQELEFLQWKDEKDGCLDEWTWNRAVTQIDRQAELLLTPATVNVGDGVTVNLWSDAHAATVIKKTKTTVTVQYDKATLDPNWKPEWIPGGFAGHCVNQDEQTYTYERNPNGRIETYHWSNKYCSYGQPGNLRLTKGRREFYDYNF